MIDRLPTDNHDLKRTGFAACYSNSRIVYGYTLAYEDVLRAFSISKTTFNQLNLGRHAIGVSDERRFCPILIVRAVCKNMDRRGQSFRQYVAALKYGNQTRRRKYHVETRATTYSTLQNTLAVIDRLTRNSPKARAVFEKELVAIGVALPENAQQS